MFETLLPLLERYVKSLTCVCGCRADLHLRQRGNDVILLCRDLEAYIDLYVPVIEDGNNFGVEVQEAMLDNVRNVMRYARQAQALPRTHYADRMKLAMTWCPHLEDHAVRVTISVSASR